MNHRGLRHLGALAAAWALVALPVSVLLFVNGERQTTVAGHDAVVAPAFDGYATLDLGPYVPNLRYPTGRRIGAEIDLGKTTLPSYDALIERYALLGAQPEGEIAKVGGAIRSLALASAAGGAAAGLAGPALWLLLGPRRRGELFRQLTARRAGLGGVALVALAAVVLQPWDRRPSTDQATRWLPIAEELPGVPIPAQARGLEVEAGLFTSGTKRIAESLIDSYAKGLAFYSEVAEAVPEIEEELRQPEDGETVALLVSDRHDNVGMDKVARAIADAGGATVLLSAGDDTSTGSAWEAFSLDSLNRVFGDLEHRFAVTGNHDQGDFVGEYLAELGFERFEDGAAAEGPDGIRFLGADDPRSSGLGSWRDETGLSFRDHADRVADRACQYDERGDRIATLLVHDANTGRYALDRGCVDLVVAGHVHEQLGPTAVVGANGNIGYTYSTGTTGGAAYAIAIGSKPRRNAMVTLVTYRDGRPVGVQRVTIRTVGDFRVGEYVELDPPVGEPAEPVRVPER